MIIVCSNNDVLFTDNCGVVILQLTAATRRDLFFKNKERRMWCVLHLFTSSQVNLLLEWGHNQSEDTIQPIRRQAGSRHVTWVQCRERRQSCWLAQTGKLIPIILYIHSVGKFIFLWWSQVQFTVPFPTAPNSLNDCVKIS